MVVLASGQRVCPQHEDSTDILKTPKLRNNTNFAVNATTLSLIWVTLHVLTLKGSYSSVASYTLLIT
jgi:hypothetical protein